MGTEQTLSSRALMAERFGGMNSRTSVLQDSKSKISLLIMNHSRLNQLILVVILTAGFWVSGSQENSARKSFVGVWKGFAVEGRGKIRIGVPSSWNFESPRQPLKVWSSKGPQWWIMAKDRMSSTSPKPHACWTPRRLMNAAGRRAMLASIPWKGIRSSGVSVPARHARRNFGRAMGVSC